jgi:asparagine synthetase B (glutamine-hydrolysing)
MTSGAFGILENELSNNINVDYLLNTINQLNLCNTHIIDINGNGVMGVSSLQNTPLKRDKYFEDNKWVVVFAGDIIDQEKVPFIDIIALLEQKKFNEFKKFNGIFSIIAYNKESTKLFIISDRLSLNPIFYLMDKEGFYFSTELSTFCRFDKKFKFNERWLWEYLFFNFPITDATFLEEVKRMPAASILEYEMKSGKYSIFEYEKKFKKKEDLINGIEALELASKIFSNRVPKYFEGVNDIACALTGGWDGRTLLALAPDPNIVTAYTYGVPECEDLRGGRRTAKLANIKHKEIYFDDEFLENLPHYMLETVFLSSGLEKINRATLLYAYQKLTEQGTKYPLIISGISFDMQFRGHACSPFLVSFAVANLFKGGKREINKEQWSSVFKTDYSLFEEHILQKIEYLENNFGNLKSTAHHLSFILYEISSKYFCGEIKISNNYTTLRVPSWDSKIIDLSYSIKQSTLSFSEFSEHIRGGKEEVVLQSYLLNKLSPRFAKIPVQLERPDINFKGGTFYYIYRIYRFVMDKILMDILHPKTKNVPLEDWNNWLNKTHKDFIDNLIFSKDSEIGKYIKTEFLEKLQNDREIFYIGKLATIEIILRLKKNNWEKFW